MGNSSSKSQYRGLSNVFQAGVGGAESLLGLPDTLKTIAYVGLAVVGILLFAVIGTMCFSVGSGRIDVNELARTAAEASKNIPVIPV